MNLPPVQSAELDPRSPRPGPGGGPSRLDHSRHARSPFFSATEAEAKKFLHVSSWILNKKHRSRRHHRSRCRAPAPTSRPRPAPPLTCGLRRGATPGGRSARRRAPEQQQQAVEPEGGGTEESPGSPLRRHLFPESEQPPRRRQRRGALASFPPARLSRSLAAGSAPAAAAAAAPARPGPARAAPLAGGETRGRLPPAGGRGGEESREGSQYIPGPGGG